MWHLFVVKQGRGIRLGLSMGVACGGVKLECDMWLRFSKDMLCHLGLIRAWYVLGVLQGRGMWLGFLQGRGMWLGFCKGVAFVNSAVQKLFLVAFKF